MGRLVHDLLVRGVEEDFVFLRRGLCCWLCLCSNCSILQNIRTFWFTSITSHGKSCLGSLSLGILALGSLAFRCCLLCNWNFILFICNQRWWWQGFDQRSKRFNSRLK